MDRELALEVTRVTEGAALAAAKWLGRGDKIKADGAATNAMREIFDSVNMKGRVVIGEGEMDEAPMLYIGEELGTGNGPEVDIAVDPIEGTTIVAKGYTNAMTVLAIADRGKLLHAPDMYMEKLAVGPNAAGKVSLSDPIEKTIEIVAEASNKKVEDVTVMVLERPRHEELIDQIRKKGARVKMFSDNDISASIATALPGTGVDLFVGIGGALKVSLPQPVSNASVVKCKADSNHKTMQKLSVVKRWVSKTHTAFSNSTTSLPEMTRFFQRQASRQAQFSGKPSFSAEDLSKQTPSSCAPKRRLFVILKPCITSNTNRTLSKTTINQYP